MAGWQTKRSPLLLIWHALPHFGAQRSQALRRRTEDFGSGGCRSRDWADLRRRQEDHREQILPEPHGARSVAPTESDLGGHQRVRGKGVLHCKRRYDGEDRLGAGRAGAVAGHPERRACCWISVAGKVVDRLKISIPFMCVGMDNCIGDARFKSGLL